jgi:hypothetical protein
MALAYDNLIAWPHFDLQQAQQYLLPDPKTPFIQGTN